MAIVELFEYTIVTTAVATIPVTSTEVVDVVAERVLLKIRLDTRSVALGGRGVVRGVLAMTKVAVLVLIGVANSTAVTTVVFAPLDIIFIVAKPVAQKRHQARGGGMVGVQTLAVVTIFRLNFAAAVATVPIARRNIVFVITKAVVLVLRQQTSRAFFLGLGVKALTSFAVHILIVVVHAATGAAVPPA